MADPSEQILGVLFPLAGTDVTSEFGRQPDNTTPGGQNVRAFEVITERGRGGSRCGLSRWINQLVNGVASPVQYLTVLVDPEDPALNAPADDGTFPDPSTNNLSNRNPGRNIRFGGSGQAPNRNVGTKKTIRFIQFNFTSSFTDVTTAVLGTRPGPQSTLVAYVFTFTPDPYTVAAANLSGGAGETYTQVGGPGYTSQSAFTNGTITTTVGITAFYRVATGSASEQVLSATLSGIGTLGSAAVLLIEYAGANALHPISGQSNGASASNVSPDVSGSVALNNTAGQFVSAAYYATDLNAANPGPLLGPFTLPAGFTERNIGLISPSDPFGQNQSFRLFERSGIQAPSVTVQAAPNSGAAFASLAVALTK